MADDPRAHRGEAARRGLYTDEELREIAERPLDPVLRRAATFRSRLLLERCSERRRAGTTRSTPRRSTGAAAAALAAAGAVAPAAAARAEAVLEPDPDDRGALAPVGPQPLLRPPPPQPRARADAAEPRRSQDLQATASCSSQGRARAAGAAREGARGRCSRSGTRPRRRAATAPEGAERRAVRSTSCWPRSRTATPSATRRWPSSAHLRARGLRVRHLRGGACTRAWRTWRGRSGEYADVSSADTVCLFHFSIGSAAGRLIHHAPDRLVVVYHNITPAHFFLGFHPHLAGLCYHGRRELAAFAPRTELALGDSEFNRRELEQAGFARTGVLPIVLDLDALRARRPRRSCGASTTTAAPTCCSSAASSRTRRSTT